MRLAVNGGDSPIRFMRAAAWGARGALGADPCSTGGYRLASDVRVDPLESAGPPLRARERDPVTVRPVAAHAWAGRSNVLRALAATALVCVVAHGADAQPTPAPSPFDGLNLLLTRQRLDEVKDAVRRGHPLMTQCRDQVVADAAAFLTRDPDPIVGVLKVPGFYTSQRARQQQITRQVRGDAYGANCLALAYALTDDVRYADRAERYLFAWVDSLTGAKDDAKWYQFLNPRGDTPLVIAYSFPSFINAYDVLRGLGRIDAAEEARFTTWLRKFVAYHRKEEGFLNNHHAWQTYFLAASAHVLGDRALFAEAIDRYRRAYHHQVGAKGALWRELIRREKAATYTLMALEGMMQTVLVAERHGDTSLRGLEAKGLFGKKGDGHVTIQRAVDHLRAFIDDPRAWRRHRWLTWTSSINAPARPSEWGYLFELAQGWWGPSYAPYTADAPYGLTPPRCYTLSYATLLFRPITWPPAAGGTTTAAPPTTGATGALGAAGGTP